jgi:hypothetical protein
MPGLLMTLRAAFEMRRIRRPLTSFWQVRACEHADFDVDI